MEKSPGSGSQIAKMIRVKEEPLQQTTRKNPDQNNWLKIPYSGCNDTQTSWAGND
jgi:hypothetical protein